MTRQGTLPSGLFPLSVVTVGFPRPLSSSAFIVRFHRLLSSSAFIVYITTLAHHATVNALRPVPARRPLRRQNRQTTPDPVRSRLHAPPRESRNRVATSLVQRRFRRDQAVLQRGQRAARQDRRRVLGNRCCAHQGDRSGHQPRRQGG